MKVVRYFAGFLAAVALVALPASARAGDVRAFGAKGDGTTKDTAAIQRAIDAQAAAGGGTVDFPAGKYLCGTLHLRSYITLRLEPGATLLGSRNLADYEPREKLPFMNDADSDTATFHQALILGENVEHVAIVGEGTIDANFTHKTGPKPIALKLCRYVKIEGIRILNSPNYNISMLGTDFVAIDGVTILNGYEDGIDPDCCQNVSISNCHIESTDDALVLKSSFSLGRHRACKNVTVTNCYLGTTCLCFKTGTESGGGFEHIAVSNCVMSGIPGRSPSLCGVALESADGAIVDDVVVSNIAMHYVQAPIYIRLDNRGRDMAVPKPGAVRNVCISDIVADDAWLTSQIAGIPGYPVGNVTISNMRVTYAGGMKMRPINEPVPEQIHAYPDVDAFGPLPTYGFYCRHVDGLRMSNVQLLARLPFRRTETSRDTEVAWNQNPPQPSKIAPLGPAMIFDDVSGLRIDGIDALASSDGSPVVRFDNVRDALVRGCVAPVRTKTYLQVQGRQTSGVFLMDNVLQSAARAVACSRDVSRGAVHMEAQR